MLLEIKNRGIFVSPARVSLSRFFPADSRERRGKDVKVKLPLSTREKEGRKFAWSKSEKPLAHIWLHPHAVYIPRLFIAFFCIARTYTLLRYAAIYIYIYSPWIFIAPITRLRRFWRMPRNPRVADCDLCMMKVHVSWLFHRLDNSLWGKCEVKVVIVATQVLFFFISSWGGPIC